VQVRLLLRVGRAQRIKEQLANYTCHYLLIDLFPQIIVWLSLAFFLTLFNCSLWLGDTFYRVFNFLWLVYWLNRFNDGSYRNVLAVYLGSKLVELFAILSKELSMLTSNFI
jgi:hypothetical protein